MQTRVGAQFGDAIELLGYDLARANDALALTVYWRSRAETRTNWTVFAQLLGDVNSPAGSPVWAQDDSQPGRGTYPTSHWRVGEMVIDHYRLPLSAVPRGSYWLEMGLYDLETGARLPAKDASGARMEKDSAKLERLSLP